VVAVSDDAHEEPEEFAVSVRFTGPNVVVAVCGALDALSSPDLGAVVDAVIDRGHQTVVLDVADLDFIDAAGLRVVAKGARLLALTGGALLLRAPSAMVLRLLAVTGMAGLVAIDHAELPTHLGPEQAVAAESPGRPRSRDLTRQVRVVTAIPADDDVVDGALGLVVALARATVGGADGVSVSLRRHGRLATVAASDATISAMDADQYATGEGPCVDASVEGRWFHIESLEAESRWPAFVPRARSLGINAILSSPLLASGRPVGALNIYSRDVAAFTPEDQKLAAVFATEASTILTGAGVDVTDTELASRLQDALRGREVIAQAQGVLMDRDGVDEDRAYTSLLRASLDAGMPLRSHALDVIASARRGPVAGSRAGQGQADDG
jgi:anti-anti-sigma factor